MEVFGCPVVLVFECVAHEGASCKSPSYVAGEGFLHCIDAVLLAQIEVAACGFCGCVAHAVLHVQEGDIVVVHGVGKVAAEGVAVVFAQAVVGEFGFDDFLDVGEG